MIVTTSNRFAENRDELLNTEDVESLLEAQVVVEAWRIEYNIFRPTRLWMA